MYQDVFIYDGTYGTNIYDFIIIPFFIIKYIGATSPVGILFNSVDKDIFIVESQKGVGFKYHRNTVWFSY